MGKSGCHGAHGDVNHQIIGESTVAGKSANEMEVFVAGKKIELNGGCSTEPRLISGE